MSNENTTYENYDVLDNAIIHVNPLTYEGYYPPRSEEEIKETINSDLAYALTVAPVPEEMKMLFGALVNYFMSDRNDRYELNFHYTVPSANCDDAGLEEVSLDVASVGRNQPADNVLFGLFCMMYVFHGEMIVEQKNPVTKKKLRYTFFVDENGFQVRQPATTEALIDEDDGYEFVFSAVNIARKTN